MLAAGSGYAQQASDIAQATQIDEIVVTAQRRTERVQDVPIDVAVMTSKDLANTGTLDSVSLGTQIPSLQQSRQNTGATIYLRGVGTIGSPGVENAVATYIDDVYVNGFPAESSPSTTWTTSKCSRGRKGLCLAETPPVVSFTSSRKIELHTRVECSGGLRQLRYVYVQPVRHHRLRRQRRGDLAFESRNQRKGWGHDLTTGQQVNLGQEYAIRNKWLWSPSAVVAF